MVLFQCIMRSRGRRPTDLTIDRAFLVSSLASLYHPQPSSLFLSPPTNWHTQQSFSLPLSLSLHTLFISKNPLRIILFLSSSLSLFFPPFLPFFALVQPLSFGHSLVSSHYNYCFSWNPPSFARHSRFALPLASMYLCPRQNQNTRNLATKMAKESLFFFPFFLSRWRDIAT